MNDDTIASLVLGFILAVGVLVIVGLVTILVSALREVMRDE